MTNQIITEKQLREIFNLKIDEPRKRLWNGKITEDFEVNHSINCPCGKDMLYSERCWLGKKQIVTIRELKNICLINSHRLMTHIRYKIRMFADKFHIDLLIQLLGKEEAIKLLEIWAKKNMLVAMALAKYIQELKEQEILN